MKNLLALLMCVCTLTYAQVTYTPLSNTGSIVSIPIPNSGGLSVNVATGSAALPLQNINQNPAAVNVQLGDDSSTNVPLGFTFPYWGQNFTNSWMYSNGIVSFVNGNIPGAGCCNGQNLATLTDTRYNYAIMPLWTDLIDINRNATWYLRTPTSMTYGWYGTHEFYNNNTSSFEVNINSSGAFDIRFGNAFVSTGHTVTSGFTGDLSQGQYFQYYHGQGFNVPTNNPVSYGSLGINMCLINPLSDPSCPGYAQAFHDQQCTINPLYMSDCPGYQQAYFTQQCNINPLYDSSCPGYAETYFNQQCQSNGLYSTQCPNYSTAYATRQALNMSSNNTNIIIPSTTTDLTTTPAVSADPVVNNVVSSSSSTAASTTTSQTSPTSVTSQTSVVTAPALTNPTNPTSVVTMPSITTIDSSSQKPQPKVDRKEMAQKVEKALNSNKEAKSIEEQKANQGLIVSAMGYVPGFDAYSNVRLLDSPFYKPFSIYKNQVTVDNKNGSRRLFGSSDKKYEELINSQYNKGN